jgi:hypothetical protein
MINETTIPSEIMATNNETLTENITPTTSADDVVTPAENATTTNDHRDSMNMSSRSAFLPTTTNPEVSQYTSACNNGNPSSTGSSTAYEK